MSWFRALLRFLGFLRSRETLNAAEMTGWDEFGASVSSYLWQAPLASYGLKPADRLQVCRAVPYCDEETLARITSARSRMAAIAEEAAILCDLVEAGRRRHGSFHALFSDALTEAVLDVVVAVEE